MFVDNVLCAGQAKLVEWWEFHQIISNFGLASRLFMNKVKSELISDIDDPVMQEIASIFGLKIRPLSHGFKYLGFQLKPNSYEIQDWYWLIHKFEKKLFLWENKWLSMGGWLIMIKAVLQGISIYWMHLFLLPKAVAQRINSIIVRFLWSGVGNIRKPHLVRLDHISDSVEEGG